MGRHQLYSICLTRKKYLLSMMLPTNHASPKRLDLTECLIQIPPSWMFTDMLYVPFWRKFCWDTTVQFSRKYVEICGTICLGGACVYMVLTRLC